MSDIITRLLLKTNEFDANLNNAKQSVNGFQGGISSMAKTVGTGVLKFAGTVGVAVGAGEAFMKTIRSSQSTNDEWDNSLNACKDTVDVFFKSLSTGDFGAFNGGLLGTMKTMKELSALRDSLGDAKLSMGYNTKTFDAQFTQYEAIIRDTNKSAGERKDAFNKLNNLKNNFKTDIDDTLNGSVQTLLKEFNSKSGRSDFTIDDIQKYISINNNDFSSRSEKRALAEYQSKLKKLQEKQYTTQYIGGGVFAGSSKSVENEGVTREIQSLKSANKELEKQNWLNNDNDASRLEMIKNLEYIQDLKKKGYDFDKRTLELQNSLKSIKTEDKPLSGSLAYFDAEISKKNKELIKATDAQARAAIQASINELESQKIELLVREKDGSLEALSAQISALKVKFASATTDDARKEIYKLISELESKQLHINLTAKYDDGKLPLKNAGLPTHGIDTKKMKLSKFKSPISKKDVKLNKDYNDSLAAMGSVMEALSGAFDGNTQSVLQWGATLFQTIGQAIPAILSMIPAKKASANASKEEATAATLNAGAQTMEAHAGIPFAGIAIGLAGVASIIAVLSSMPKFATGGVVPGVSFTGDKVPAWLNSGEMILNGGQQANLFKMLNSGIYGGITADQIQPNFGNVSRLIMPTESRQEIALSGDFRVKGSDLELAIKNYTHKKSKVR